MDDADERQHVQDESARVPSSGSSVERYGLLVPCAPQSKPRCRPRAMQCRSFRQASDNEVRELAEKVAAKADDQPGTAASSLADRIQEHTSKKKQLERRFGQALRWGREQDRPRSSTMELTHCRFEPLDNSDDDGDRDGDEVGWDDEAEENLLVDA
eukprot:gb/GFBE01017990.1/.p1 GENE.gb/GFBE01017990.1/~~gb/GFBE01017990.1/.p1  ORF type:complete len:156 (+),score=34.17 gb/GFBE01017990.1/:1-468(+)